MGKRGEGRFRKLDVVRAVKAARDAGLAADMVEIIAKDGTVIRVHGSKATAEATREVMSAAEWDKEIAKLKAKKGS
jgi:hypothetical protein